MRICFFQSIPSGMEHVYGVVFFCEDVKEMKVKQKTLKWIEPSRLVGKCFHFTPQQVILTGTCWTFTLDFKASERTLPTSEQWKSSACNQDSFPPCTQAESRKMPQTKEFPAKVIVVLIDATFSDYSESINLTDLKPEKVERWSSAQWVPPCLPTLSTVSDLHRYPHKSSSLHP